MELDIDLIPLFIICAVAWLIPMGMSMLGMGKVPAVIIEIIAGIIIGDNVLGWVSGTPYLEFLALIGFIFLMFLSGLEVEVDHVIATFPKKGLTLARFLANPFLVGLMLYIGTLGLSVIAAKLLSTIIEISNPWNFALIMSTSSVGIIVPVLKNRGESQYKYGQMIILSAAIADIFSILLFTFTASYLKHGFRYEILFIFSLIAAFFIAYYLGRYFIRLKLIKKLFFKLSHAASQIKVRGTMLLILAFVIVSQLVDAEVILGAFLSGLILSIFLTKSRSALMIKLDGMGFGFFIPIFFIMVGAELDLSALQEFDNSFLFLFLFLISLYLVKIIPSFIWWRLFGFRKSIAGGILLSSRLSLIIAAAQIGLELGVIAPAMNAAVIIVAIVTCTFSPILYENINIMKRIKDYKTIIVGGDKIGIEVAERMKMHGYQAVIVEINEKRYKEIKNMGIDTYWGDGRNMEIYKELGLKDDNYVVVVTDDKQTNIEVSENVRHELQHENVITKPVSVEESLYLKNKGVKVVDIEWTIATNIENLILRPSTYTTLIESFENYAVEEIIITNKDIDGKQVKDFLFHKDGSLMMLKRKKGESLIPHGDTYFHTGDLVTVLGNEEALDDFREKFG
ncbi:MAG: monovalent cation:proton antiporter family protein [Flavobacteriales bacterium]